jgi:cell division septal protein FtsQ
VVVRLLVLGVTLSGLGVAAFVAWDWARRTPLLATRTVEVAGARRLDEATVRVAAAIEPGTNLFLATSRPPRLESPSCRAFAARMSCVTCPAG